VQLKNEGGGMLYGCVTVEADWLALGDGPGSPRKVFQLHDALALHVQIISRNLRASLKPIEGRLIVESNGGRAELVVRLELPCRPFPSGVLAGALTPRELAKKAHASPREALSLFDNGAVRQWYESNGWTYPIRGPVAKGLAGIQQFFESLGLTKAPRVLISTSSIHLLGKPGETLQYQLQVQAMEKKHLFAHARSTVGWLEVTSTTLTGRRAQILLRVPQVPRLPGQQMHGFVHVTANAGQRFTVEVHLLVQGERETVVSREMVPALGLDDVLPAVTEEAVIPIAPMTLSDLLDAQAEWIDEDDHMPG
jgi:hypothetical protein